MVADLGEVYIYKRTCAIATYMTVVATYYISAVFYLLLRDSIAASAR